MEAVVVVEHWVQEVGRVPFRRFARRSIRAENIFTWTWIYNEVASTDNTGNEGPFTATVSSFLQQMI